MIKKILAVDDSALMRKVLSDIIEFDKRFILADSANNGLEAYDLLTMNPTKYDLVILDINMPKMNGIQLMEKLNAKSIRVPILIVSTIAREGAYETIRCLELGAFDFVTKPDSFLETKGAAFRDRIISLMCAATKLEDKRVHTDEKSISKTPESTKLQLQDQRMNPMSYVMPQDYVKRPHQSVSAQANRLIAIACSTGGPKALQSVIPKLPANLNAPIIMVQHMPDGFTATLAQRLNDMSALTVKEAEDGEIIKKGFAYLARGGKQMRLNKSGSNYVLNLYDEEARNGLRPCADIMYESLAGLDFDEITCVVLTGMGSDGTRGIGQLNDTKNLYVIAQDEVSSTVYGMPRMVKEAGLVNEVTALGTIADAIIKNVGVH